MKRFVSIIITLLFSHLSLFATTPYNLEGIRALRVLIIDIDKTISSEQSQKIISAVKSKLKKSGIKSKKEGVGALYIKLTSTTIAETTVVYINFAVGEEIEVKRAWKVSTFALTYSYDDMIDSKTIDVEAEVYDSIVNFLTDEFLAQYSEDNEE